MVPQQAQPTVLRQHNLQQPGVKSTNNFSCGKVHIDKENLNKRKRSSNSTQWNTQSMQPTVGNPNMEKNIHTDTNLGDVAPQESNSIQDSARISTNTEYPFLDKGLLEYNNRDV